MHKNRSMGRSRSVDLNSYYISHQVTGAAPLIALVNKSDRCTGAVQEVARRSRWLQEVQEVARRSRWLQGVQEVAKGVKERQAYMVTAGSCHQPNYHKVLKNRLD